MEQLSPCVRTTEPVSRAWGPRPLSPCAATAEARTPQNPCSATRAATPMRSPCASAGEQPHSPQLKESLLSNEDLAQPKIIKKRNAYVRYKFCPDNMGKIYILNPWSFKTLPAVILQSTNDVKPIKINLQTFHFPNVYKANSFKGMCIYIYMYTHTHTHTHIYKLR